MEECPYATQCSNISKACFKCIEFNKYKPLKIQKGLSAKSSTRKERKEGMDFEKRGARAYNQAVHRARDVARQQVGSGAFGGLAGDVITSEELTASLAEFKERGSTDARGAKQITIKLEWLTKLEEEAKEMNRNFYYLPFSFKGHDKDYVAMEFNMLLKYIETIQILLEQNKLMAEANELKNVNSIY